MELLIALAGGITIWLVRADLPVMLQVGRRYGLWVCLTRYDTEWCIVVLSVTAIVASTLSYAGHWLLTG